MNQFMNDESILDVAMNAARAGGVTTQKYFADLATAGIENKSVNEKDEGLVTRADIEAEQAIVAEIKKSFPDHQILAEEEHANDSGSAIDADHLWIIDPLDGTNNFANGMPHYGVSVAYYQKGAPYCGVVLAPETDDLFSAVQGRGAWHNGKQVHVNAQNELSQAMIGVGFYYDRGEMMRDTLAAIDSLFTKNIIGIRRMGTASLDLVQVGLGRFGGYFEYTLSPWDFAAGRLFVTEAGGQVTTCDGGEVPIAKSSILATNGLLHDKMLECIRYRNQ
jgi:myo-inositol-1(or 4)-monophosphatase